MASSKIVGIHPLQAAVAALQDFDLSNFNCLGEVRNLEEFTPLQLPVDEIPRLVASNRRQLEDTLPAAHALIGMAADLVTAATGTSAESAIRDRADRYRRLTKPGTRFDRIRAEIVEIVTKAFNMFRADRRPFPVTVDDRLWLRRTRSRFPAGLDVDIFGTHFGFLLVEALFAAREVLQLNLPFAVQILTLHLNRHAADIQRIEECRSRLLPILAEAAGDRQHGCWLLHRCHAAVRIGGTRDLAARLVRAAIVHRKSLVDAATSVVDAAGVLSDVTQEGIPRLPKRPGRPPDPKKTRRDRLIQKEWERNPNRTYRQVADVLAPQYPELKFSKDIVRTALKGRRDRRRKRRGRNPSL